MRAITLGPATIVLADDCTDGEALVTIALGAHNCPTKMPEGVFEHSVAYACSTDGMANPMGVILSSMVFAPIDLHIGQEAVAPKSLADV